MNSRLHKSPNTSLKFAYRLPSFPYHQTRAVIQRPPRPDAKRHSIEHVHSILRKQLRREIENNMVAHGAMIQCRGL